MARIIIIEAVTRNRDGSDAVLVYDLSGLMKVDRDWLMNELHRLSDDAILYRCQRLNWRPSAEGTWVLLKIAPYCLICQLELVNPELFGIGHGSGILKVVRLVHESFVAEVLAEQRVHDGEEDEA